MYPRSVEAGKGLPPSPAPFSTLLCSIYYSTVSLMARVFRPLVFLIQTQNKMSKKSIDFYEMDIRYYYIYLIINYTKTNFLLLLK